jgi:hypothetical protein
MPDTLPRDSEITIEVDDGTFVPRETVEQRRARVCGYLPYDSDIVIEWDE